MSKAGALFSLQHVDTDLDARRAQLADVESRIGESDAIAEAHAELAERRVLLQAVLRRVRDAEVEASDLERHIAELNKKLYGGTIRAPRELQDLQKDIDSIQAQRAKVDDRGLDAMVEQEALQEEIREREAQLAQMTENWAQEQADLQERSQTLGTDIARLEAQRTVQVAQVDRQSLWDYDAQRTKRPLAVAAVIQGQCQGCRIGQPTMLLHRARAEDVLIHCNSCGRILYVAS